MALIRCLGDLQWVFVSKYDITINIAWLFLSLEIADIGCRISTYIDLQAFLMSHVTANIYLIKFLQHPRIKKDYNGMAGVDDISEFKHEYVDHYPYPDHYPRPHLPKLEDHLKVSVCSLIMSSFSKIITAKLKIRICKGKTTAHCLNFRSKNQ